MFSISISHYPTKLTITLTRAHERCLRHDRASHHHRRGITGGPLKAWQREAARRPHDDPTALGARVPLVPMRSSPRAPSRIVAGPVRAYSSAGTDAHRGCCMIA